MYFIFFFNDTATTEIYTLSLHDALPICYRAGYYGRTLITRVGKLELRVPQDRDGRFSTELFERYQRSEQALVRSEEHTSELQSRQYLVCRLLLEKKKKNHTYHTFCNEQR